VSAQHNVGVVYEKGLAWPRATKKQRGGSEELQNKATQRPRFIWGICLQLVAVLDKVTWKQRVGIKRLLTKGLSVIELHLFRIPEDVWMA